MYSLLISNCCCVRIAVAAVRNAYLYIVHICEITAYCECIRDILTVRMINGSDLDIAACIKSNIAHVYCIGDHILAELEADILSVKGDIRYLWSRTAYEREVDVLLSGRYLRPIALRRFKAFCLAYYLPVALGNVPYISAELIGKDRIFLIEISAVPYNCLAVLVHIVNSHFSALYSI